MCLYCALHSKLDNIGLTASVYYTEFESLRHRVMCQDVEAERLLEMFAGPNGAALYKAYRIRMGLDEK